MPSLGVHAPYADVQAPSLGVQAPCADVQAPYADVQTPFAEGSRRPVSCFGEEITPHPNHSFRIESLDGIDATGLEGWKQRCQKGHTEKDAGGSKEHQWVPGIDLKKEALEDLGATPSTRQAESETKGYGQ